MKSDKQLKLSECLLLANVSETSITKSRTHKELQASTNKAANATSEVIGAPLKLWPVSPATNQRAYSEISRIQKAAKDYWKQYTVPVPPEFGGRGLPSLEFEAFCEGFSEFQMAHTEAVAKFVQEYDQHLAEAEANASDWTFTAEDGEKKIIRMFNPDWYPDKDSVADEFTLKLTYTPIPDRLDRGMSGIADAALDVINESMAETLDAMESMIKTDLVDRVLTPLTEIVRDVGDPDKKFSQSKLTKIATAHETLRRLALPGTQELISLCKTIEDDVVVDAQTIRDDDVVRREIVSKAAAHMEKLESLF